MTLDYIKEQSFGQATTNSSVGGKGCPTPLVLAAARCSVRVAKLLLDRNDIDVDADHRTALRCAAKMGKSLIMKLLLERVDTVVNTGGLLVLAASHKSAQVVVKLLLERNDVDVNVRDYTGRTALDWAAQTA
jgi:ankyrin repeat protein